jgi:hypothetical protein
MQEIQIDGIFTYIENVKNLKLGDKVRLKLNQNNRINKEAVGVYTDKTNLKLGYIPFKASQLDITQEYKIEKIHLNQKNLLVTISREFSVSNFLEKIDDNNNDKDLKKSYIEDLKVFKKNLERNFSVSRCEIIYCDENFINLLVEIENNELDNETNIYNLVTRKYYEQNVFIYDEFYNFNLIPFNIFKLFSIHRLEVYIENSYKSIDKIKKKKIQEFIDKNKFELNPANIIIEDFTKTDLCYSHKLKAYCNVDYYNKDAIISKQDDLINLILKMIISNRLLLYIYNKDSLSFELKINDNIKNNISDLI